MRVAIETKATARITSTQLRGLRAIVRDHPGIEQRIVVCLEAKSRRTEDDILILPAMISGAACPPANCSERPKTATSRSPRRIALLPTRALAFMFIGTVALAARLPVRVARPSG